MVQTAPIATGFTPAQASLGGMPHDSVHGSALSKPLQPRSTIHQVTGPAKHDNEFALQLLKKQYWFPPPRRKSYMATAAMVDVHSVLA